MYSRNSKTPWVQLNWNVPFNEIFCEAKRLSNFFVTHRPEDKHKGWKAVTIYGYNSKNTKSHWEYLNLYKNKKKTTHAGKMCPKTLKWIETLPFSRIDDIRFLILNPKGVINPHIDVPDRNWLDPVSVAIHWPKQCQFKFTHKGFVPFATGKSFVLNIHYEHGVINHSNETRVNLLIHGKKRGDFWNDVILTG